MRMDNEQYFRSCVAKERHLAQLLGHSNIEECYESAGTLWDKAQALPQWTRDWAACEPLLTQYQLVLSHGTAADSAELVTVTVGDTSVALVEHPSRERAVMFAIVKEVIRLLEHHRHHHLSAAMAESAAPLQPHPYK